MKTTKTVTMTKEEFLKSIPRIFYVGLAATTESRYTFEKQKCIEANTNRIKEYQDFLEAINNHCVLVSCTGRNSYDRTSSSYSINEEGYLQGNYNHGTKEDIIKHIQEAIALRQAVIDQYQKDIECMNRPCTEE